MPSAPPNTSQTGKVQNGIDIDVFKKLVARFDSNYAGEAETAFRKAVTLCAQAQIRFCDAAAEAYGQSPTITRTKVVSDSAGK